MDTEGDQINPQKKARKPARRKRQNGCLVAFAVIFLLLILGAIWIYRPRFSASEPTQIEVGATQPEEGKYYETSITKRNACNSIIDFFGRGTLEIPCMCKGFGTFEIHHENGSIENLALLPGHSGPESFQIRKGLLHYGLSRKDFVRLLKDASVDESKIFAYDEFLRSSSTSE